MESGLETFAGGPLNSLSSGWERSRSSSESGVILDSEGASGTVGALSCKSKSAATLTCSKDVAFLAKNVSILCVVFFFLEIVSFSLFFFEHRFYACSQTSLNRVNYLVNIMSAIKNLKFMQRAQSICNTKLLKMHVYVYVNMYNVILTIFF